MRYASTHYHIDPIIGRGAHGEPLVPIHSANPPIRTRKAAFAALIPDHTVSVCRTSVRYCREARERSEAMANGSYYEGPIKY